MKLKAHKGQMFQARKNYLSEKMSSRGYLLRKKTGILLSNREEIDVSSYSKALILNCQAISNIYDFPGGMYEVDKYLKNNWDKRMKSDFFIMEEVCY